MVALPRRHVVVIAVLVCVPLPLLSLGALIVPLPELLERAAASFVSIAVPTRDHDGLLREKASPTALRIVYRFGEPLTAPVEAPATTRASDAPKARPRSSTSRPARARAGRAQGAPIGVRSQPLSTGDEVGSGEQPPSPAPDGPPAPQGEGRTSDTPGAPQPTPKPADQPGGGGTSGGSGAGGDGSGGSGTKSGGGSGSGGTSGGGGSGGSGGSSPTEPPKADPGTGAGSGGNGGGSSASPPRDDNAQPPGGGRP
jgi:hypothetical protein